MAYVIFWPVRLHWPHHHILRSLKFLWSRLKSLQIQAKSTETKNPVIINWKYPNNGLHHPLFSLKMCPQRCNVSVCDFSSKVEMGKWIEDLNLAIDMAKKSQEKSSIFLDAGLSDRSNRKFSLNSIPTQP